MAYVAYKCNIRRMLPSVWETAEGFRDWDSPYYGRLPDQCPALTTEQGSWLTETHAPLSYVHTLSFGIDNHIRLLCERGLR